MKIDRNIVPQNDVNRNRENNENCNGASTIIKNRDGSMSKNLIKNRLNKCIKSRSISEVLFVGWWSILGGILGAEMEPKSINKQVDKI